MPIATIYQAAGFTPNEAQQQAIQHTAGPLFLTAGPGSGKTRVLLWRTLGMIVDQGVKPEAIFLSTFTEKAALQLKEGLRAYLGTASTRTGTPYLDANQNGPICAKKYRPPSCAVDDCRGKWVTGAGGRRSRSGSHRNWTAIGAGREGSAWSCVVGRRRGGAQGRPGQAQGDAVML